MNEKKYTLPQALDIYGISLSDTKYWRVYKLGKSSAHEFDEVGNPKCLIQDWKFLIDFVRGE